MVEKLAEFFRHQDYNVQRTNFTNVRILYKTDASNVTVIAIVDFDSEPIFTIEQYQHILEQIQNAFHGKGYLVEDMLSLLCTRDVEKVKPYCQVTRQIHWVVDVSANQLVVFENQPDSFREVRRQLDQILIGDLHKVNPEYQSAVQVKKPREERGFKPFRRDSYGYRRPIRRKFEKIPVWAILLVVSNVVLFFWREIAEGYTSGDVYLKWGATYYSSIVQNHEYYRLFTALFEHANFEHLSNNMISLMVIGYLLEPKIGGIRFLSIYFISGILANVGSVFYFHAIGELSVGLGASGAIFGVIGGLAYLMLRYRGRGFNINRGGFALFLIVTVYSGFRVQDQVDNIAHIVGFFSGVMVCSLLDCVHRNKRIR